MTTGLQFHPITSDALAQALMRAVSLFADQATWEKMQKNGMKQPVGWGPSAREYAGLYRELVGT